MGRVTVLIFHRPASAGQPELVRLLADVRARLCTSHRDAFRRAGADEVEVVAEWHAGKAFGEVLAALTPARGGLVLLSSGAVPLMNAGDAARLVAAASSPGRVAATNNRYSSDVCALSEAKSLRALPPLPSDNALPRWLEERAGYAVTELPGRERLGVDLDTPLDVALAALSRASPRWLRDAADAYGLRVPRVADLRALITDARRELVVFGRAGSATLRWLETHARCRVRFLAEERGMRASTPLAIGGAEPQTAAQPRPRATLGLLLDTRGPGALGSIVAELGAGAIIDSRVLLAHRLGADEEGWPSAADRFASDLHRVDDVGDPWLRGLTQSAASSSLPILLGGHSLVGPGIPLLLAAAR